MPELHISRDVIDPNFFDPDGDMDPPMSRLEVIDNFIDEVNHCAENNPGVKWDEASAVLDSIIENMDKADAGKMAEMIFEGRWTELGKLLGKPARMHLEEYLEI
jgi:hypothetical protein